MNILRALIVTVIGVFLLMTLWPLFIFLLVILGLYWATVSLRLKKMGQSINKEFNKPTEDPGTKKDAIDAQFTERDEE